MDQAKDLYAVLGVAKDAEQAEIKKAYYKLALRLHPDKNAGDKEASAKFQSLQRIYSVLGDPEKRKIYDQTGSLQHSEDVEGEDLADLAKYFRSVYKKVTEDDIDAFEGQYRGSEEERGDLLKYYQQFKGNMDTVFVWVMLSRPELDSHRFMDTLEQAIAAGEVKRYKAFSRWARDVATKPRPKDPLARRARRSGAGGESSMDALKAAIMARPNVDQMADKLLAKYGKPPKERGSQKKRKGSQEPSEEEFMAARQRVEARAAAACTVTAKVVLEGSPACGKKRGKKA